MTRQRVAVVGAGWAGLAAAVHATEAGHAVTLFDMARKAGGRARSTETAAGTLDNGQHILIGAYVETLALMRRVGVDIERVLERRPLRLLYPDGHGLALPGGAPWLAFVRGVAAARGWPLRDRVALLAASARWGLAGFRCDVSLSVDALCRSLPRLIRRELIEPLCVAALNTPSAQASATVFLRVLHDALFAGRGGADLLLPRGGLSALLPDPATQWLQARGATQRWGKRVAQIAAAPSGWKLDGEAFDSVVLACSAVEAARLTDGIAPPWSAVAAALRHQSITTVFLAEPRLRLPAPMVALRASDCAPAQFVFDLAALGVASGLHAFVISGSDGWVERGSAATQAAVCEQARAAFPGHFRLPDAALLRHAATERRATFACTPGLRRPAAVIAPKLFAAGDYIEGPYPATLEGAVRSGKAAAARLE